MSDIAKVNDHTDIIDATTTSARKAFTIPNSKYLILENIGTSPVFLVTGDANVTAVFPTTGTGQGGAYLSASSGQIPYRKTMPNHTHYAVITGTGTASVVVKQSEDK